METPFYQYHPLQQSDSLRILVLRPSLDETDPIACTISHVQISDKSLEYEAVSYTWGDSTQTNTIFLNDGRERLVIGDNCHAALRRLRLPEEHRTVWIDAVCINQEDPHERGHQVRMMNDVYNFASGVMVMLSDQVPDCRLLLDRLAEINNLLESGAIIARFRPNPVISQQLETLFKDPWFKRTWVLQEVHAKSLVTIMYGPATITFKALEKLFVGYYDIVARTSWPLPLQLVHRAATAQYHLTPQAGLWNRLYESRECLASNPRDKIFALKSLLGERQSAINHLIDYTQSVESCFTEVAKFLLPVVELRILCAARHPHNLNMASWIPDWSQTLPLQYGVFHHGSFSRSATAEEKRLGLPSRTYSCHYPPTGPELRVKGCRYSEILECGQVFQFSSLDDAEKQLLNIYNSVDTIRLNLDKSSQYDGVSTSVYFSQSILRAMASTDGQELYHNFTRGNNNASSGHRTENKYGRSDTDAMRTVSVRRDIRYLYEALQRCKIALMRNGRLVLVPDVAECGDVVCIAKAAMSPFLLRRRQDECWSLVSGDCYIFKWIVSDLQSVTGIATYIDTHRMREERFTIR